MDKRQELKKIIEQSQISEEDKKEWNFLVDSSPDDFAGNLLGTFSKFPDEIGWFNDIYKRKKEAFSFMESDEPKARQMLQGIFQEEKVKLDELEKAE